MEKIKHLEGIKIYFLEMQGSWKTVKGFRKGCQITTAKVDEAESFFLSFLLLFNVHVEKNYCEKRNQSLSIYTFRTKAFEVKSNLFARYILHFTF